MPTLRFRLKAIINISQSQHPEIVWLQPALDYTKVSHNLERG